MADLVSARESRLRRIERLGHVLDNSIRIPVLNYRIGWDAIIGLVPGGGDVIGLMLSAYIVYEAARLGASKAALARMVVNVGLETLIGAVPLIGDLFDATWKANARNLNLLHDYLGTDAPRRRTSDRRSLLLVGGLLVLLVVVLVAFVVGIGWVVIELLGG